VAAEAGDDRPRRLGPVHGPDAPDLAAVVAAWPTLPEAIRAGILALVKAASPGEGGGR
jgi:hypothetical protein